MDGDARWPRTAPRGVKMATKRPKLAPRWPKRAPTWLQIGPRSLSNSLKTIGKNQYGCFLATLVWHVLPSRRLATYR